MKTEFRIVEQYGVFFVEEKRKRQELISNGFAILMYNLFDIEYFLKYKKTEYWYRHSNKTRYCYLEEMEFKTKEDALKYIEQQEPKYHYL